MIEVKAPPATPETVSPLKPSEALRLGRLMRPVEITGAFFGVHNQACAMGAIAVGYGVSPKDLGGAWVEGPCGYACPAIHECPLPPLAPWTIALLVVHLNDEHHWTTEPIATWLEGLGL